mmetsp:Transcript_23691/g.58579  ORF Transcript_23691/g.58579 Transcript_23691/m.58579 type:complete len:253 (-) Transcript_23691:395-1153(-)
MSFSGGRPNGAACGSKRDGGGGRFGSIAASGCSPIGSGSSHCMEWASCWYPSDALRHTLRSKSSSALLRPPWCSPIPSIPRNPSLLSSSMTARAPSTMPGGIPDVPPTHGRKALRCMGIMLRAFAIFGVGSLLDSDERSSLGGLESISSPIGPWVAMWGAGWGQWEGGGMFRTPKGTGGGLIISALTRDGSAYDGADADGEKRYRSGGTHAGCSSGTNRSPSSLQPSESELSRTPSGMAPCSTLHPYASRTS